MQNYQPLCIGVVVAVNQKNIFGFDNRRELPWSNKTDMRYFKALTMGEFVAMGVNTYASLPHNRIANKRKILSELAACSNLSGICNTFTSNKVDRYVQAAQDFRAAHLVPDWNDICDMSQHREIYEMQEMHNINRFITDRVDTDIPYIYRSDRMLTDRHQFVISSRWEKHFFHPDHNTPAEILDHDQFTGMPVSSLSQAVQIAYVHKFNEPKILWVIGGKRLYDEAMNGISVTIDGRQFRVLPDIVSVSRIFNPTDYSDNTLTFEAGKYKLPFKKHILDSDKHEGLYRIDLYQSQTYRKLFGEFNINHL